MEISCQLSASGQRGEDQRGRGRSKAFLESRMDDHKGWVLMENSAKTGHGECETEG